MANDLYGGSSKGGLFSGGGELKLPSRTPGAPQHHGISGFLDNLANDVETTVKGIPAGVVQLVTHPEQSLKDTAKATWHDWSPLFHGDTKTWWHNFTEHPLAPILDIASIFSMGAAAPGRAATGVAKAGLLAERLGIDGGGALAERAMATKAFKSVNPEARVLYPDGSGALLSPTKKQASFLREQAKLYENDPAHAARLRAQAEQPYTPRPDVVRHYRSNPMARGRQKLVDHVTETLAEKLPAFSYFSLESKYNRLAAKQASKRRAAGKIINEREVKGAEISQGLHQDKGKLALATAFFFRNAVHAGNVIHENPALIARVIDKQIENQLHGSPQRLIHVDTLRQMIKDGQAVHLDSSMLPLRKTPLKPGEYAKWKTEQRDLGTLQKTGERPLKDGEQPLPGHEGEPTFYTQYGDGTHRFGSYDVAGGEQASLLEPPRDPLVETLKSNDTLFNTDVAEHGAYSGITDLERLLKHIDSAGLRFHMTPEELLQHPERAAVDANGYILGSVNQHLKALTGEAGGSVEALAKLFTVSTALWKYIILGLRPAYMVNNTVGNLLMYMLANNPAESLWGLHQAYRDIRSDHSALKELDALDKELAKSNLVDLTYTRSDGKQVTIPGKKSAVGRSTTGQGFSKDAGSQLTPNPEKFPRMAKWAKIATAPSRKMFELTDQLSDTTLRNASLHIAYRRDPAVMARMAKGVDYETAALEAFKDPKVRARAEHFVEQQMGQYYHFNKVEEQIRRVVPFYSWDRAIMAHALTLLNENPATVLVGSNWAMQAGEKNNEALGNVPSSIKGAIGLSGLLAGSPVDGGQKRILLTGGINPYSTLSDIVLGAKALTAGDTRGPAVLASQLNPIISTMLQGVTGRNLVTNAPVSSVQSFFYTLAKGYWNSIPMTKMVGAHGQTTYTDSRDNEQPFLFQHNFSDYLNSWLGWGSRTMSEAAAQQRFYKETGIKTPKQTDWLKLLSK